MSSTPISILVVEDEVLIRMSVVDELEDAGFRVLEAGSADEAISVLESQPNIAAVFTDIDMPGSTDGLTLAKMLRQNYPDIAVVLTSGYLKISKNDLPDKMPYVPKPYEIDSVVNHIRALISR